ncbi:hypothetical protein [Polaromonas sp. P5_D5]
MKHLTTLSIALLLGVLSACSPAPRASQDPLSIARAPVAAAINDYQRCAQSALQPLKDNPEQSVFVLADAALAACDAGLEQVRRSILADNAGHPYVAAFAEEASANIRIRTRNILAHSLNRAREAQPQPAK